MDGYTIALILFFATCVRTDCVIAAYSELLARTQSVYMWAHMDVHHIKRGNKV